MSECRDAAPVRGAHRLRKTGLYDRRGAFRESVQALHSYELLLPYVGLVACALMLAVTVTGLLLVVRDRH